MGFKSQFSNSYDNWYVQKYLKGIFHKGMLLIWKEYFTRAILSFSSPRCAIIARLNVIYTKFRRAMIAQLNKIWRVRACAHAIARNLRPGLWIVILSWKKDMETSSWGYKTIRKTWDFSKIKLKSGYLQNIFIDYAVFIFEV